MLSLCGWFGRILQRLFSDNEGCVGKSYMFPIEKCGAEAKALFEARQKMQSLLFNDTRKRESVVNLSLYFIIKSNTRREKVLLPVLLAPSQINRQSSLKCKIHTIT